VARIFAGNNRYLAQQPHCSMSDVFEIADGS